MSPESPGIGTWEVGVTHDKAIFLARKSHEIKLVRLSLAPEVLSDPVKIVRGWGRPGQEECFVYVGKPDRDFRSARVEIPAPPGMLFLIFIRPGGVIDDWGWRKASGNDETHPEGLIGETIWPV